MERGMASSESQRERNRKLALVCGLGGGSASAVEVTLMKWASLCKQPGPRPCEGTAGDNWWLSVGRRTCDSCSASSSLCVPR